MVTDLLPPVTAEFTEIALLKARAHLHRLGITSWQDACVGSLWGTQTLSPPISSWPRMAG